MITGSRDITYIIIIDIHYVFLTVHSRGHKPTEEHKYRALASTHKQTHAGSRDVSLTHRSQRVRQFKERKYYFTTKDAVKYNREKYIMSIPVTFI